MAENKKSDRDILIENIRKRITTTMIGSIDAVEKKFGFLWNNNSEDAKFMRKVFLEVRKTILDNGNAQLQAAQEEIATYEVDKAVYYTVFPAIKQERLNQNG